MHQVGTHYDDEPQFLIQIFRVYPRTSAANLSAGNGIFKSFKREGFDFLVLNLICDSASFKDIPFIKSANSLTFLGETLKYLNFAFTSVMFIYCFTA